LSAVNPQFGEPSSEISSDALIELHQNIFQCAELFGKSAYATRWSYGVVSTLEEDDAS
jgi:hypothetical protein